MVEIDLDFLFSFFHKSRIDLLVLYLLVGWVAVYPLGRTGLDTGLTTGLTGLRLNANELLLS